MSLFTCYFTVKALRTNYSSRVIEAVDKEAAEYIVRDKFSLLGEVNVYLIRNKFQVPTIC